MVLSAEHLIGDRFRFVVGVAHVSDDHDFTFGHHHPVDGPCVVGGPLAAPTEGLDLEHLGAVGQFDQSGAPGKQPTTEVGEDAEGETVELELVDDLGELIDLGGRIELRFVADQKIEPDPAHEFIDHSGPEVELEIHFDRLVRETEARGKRRLARAVVCGVDAPYPPACRVVVIGLQGKGALSRVHGPGEEEQFGHARILSQRSALKWHGPTLERRSPPVNRPRSRLSGPVLGSDDPLAHARFYSALLDWPVVDEEGAEGGPEKPWAVIRSPHGPHKVEFQYEADYRPPVWPSSAGAQQMHSHLDIGVDDLAAGVAFALTLGARPAMHQPQPDVRVMVDPCGQVFCLFADPLSSR